MRGRVFLDVGGAWFDVFGQEFDFWNSDESRLEDAVSSYGFGVTINLMGIDLNWDFAQLWDFKDSLGRRLRHPVLDRNEVLGAGRERQ